MSSFGIADRLVGFPFCYFSSWLIDFISVYCFWCFEGGKSLLGGILVLMFVLKSSLKKIHVIYSEINMIISWVQQFGLTCWMPLRMNMSKKIREACGGDECWDVVIQLSPWGSVKNGRWYPKYLLKFWRNEKGLAIWILFVTDQALVKPVSYL